MDNTLYIMKYCPFCAEMEIGAMLANCNLPIGEKIDFVDIHSGDSAINYLDETIPGDSYMLPKLIIDKKNNEGGNIMLSRYMIDSTSTKEYDFNFIKAILNRPLNSL